MKNHFNKCKWCSIKGSGSGENGTIINITGDPHVCISVRNKVNYNIVGARVDFADRYVPSNAMTFNLTDASRFAVDDTIRIIKPVTDAWIKFIGNG